MSVPAVGAIPSPEHASVLRRAVAGQLSPRDVLHLQRTAGNAAVARMLSARRAPNGSVLQREVLEHEDENVSVTYRHPMDPVGQAVTVPAKRPTRVRGRIEDNKRGATPNPLVLTSLHKSYAKVRKLPGSARTVDDEIMYSGTYDRGHMMAAEMGGADEEWNIVPQWSLNQQSGPWRVLERLAGAMKKKKKVDEVEVTAHYRADAGTWRRVGVPKTMTYRLLKNGKPVGTDGHWDNAPDEYDLVVTSEVDAALEQKILIQEFVTANGGTATAAAIVAAVLGGFTGVQNDHLEYRNANKRGKTAAKKISGPKTKERLLNLIKEMLIQGALDGPAVVNTKTSKTDIEAMKGITLGVLSFVEDPDSDEDEEDADDGEFEAQLSDDDRDDVVVEMQGVTTSTSSSVAVQQPVVQQPVFQPPQVQQPVVQVPTAWRKYRFNGSYFYSPNTGLGGSEHGEIRNAVVTATGKVHQGYFAAQVVQGEAVWGVSFWNPHGTKVNVAGQEIWLPVDGWQNWMEEVGVVLHTWGGVTPFNPSGY
ncbi:MAG TPA: DNA/RNA non-specific endonuclease [Longimicrobiaceae bacterium]|nr:DNA/RNA non-specific endonuclease [Longimicrobiaceae bacterium]